MWRLVSQSDSDRHAHLRSLNEHAGRQTWEWDPNAGTQDERDKVEQLRASFAASRDTQKHSSDELLRLQVSTACSANPIPYPQHTHTHTQRLANPGCRVPIHAARSLFLAVPTSVANMAHASTPTCVLQAASRRKRRPAFRKPQLNGGVREADVVTALRGALGFYEGLQAPSDRTLLLLVA